MDLKEQAALAAVDLVESGMALGLGTGSTAVLVVSEIARRLREGSLKKIRGVPTSEATAALALRLEIPLFTLDEVPVLDLTLDGADEVDPSWNLIKGAGGALLREKIVAQASKQVAIVVDESKLVSRLGEMKPVPIEVVPFGWRTHLPFLQALGGKPELRVAASGHPYLTDAQNYILDVRFSPESLANPQAVERAIRRRAGIVETGLFLGIASVLVVGRSEGPTRTIARSR